MVEDHRLTVRLDTKEQEREPDQRHANGQEKERGNDRSGGLLRRDEMAGSGDQRET